MNKEKTPSLEYLKSNDRIQTAFKTHILNFLEDPDSRNHLKDISDKFYPSKEKKKVNDSEMNRYASFQHLLTETLKWYTGLNKEQQVSLTMPCLRFGVVEIFERVIKNEKTAYYEG